MDAHELAIAALSQVSQTSSHRRDSGPGNVASSRSSPNDATTLRAPTAARVEHPATNNPIDSRNPVANPAFSQMASGGQTRGDGEQGQVDRGEPLQSTSSDNSQDTTDGHDTVSTPPTSEGFSSQSTNADGLSQLSQLAAAQQPLTSTVATRPNVVIPTAGQKRTADGYFKSPASANGPYHRGHTRTTSAVSNASTATSRSVAELASEMRTRFSYAMVKVNNGWTSNSIDEVESLASQAGSPTSSNSTLHGRRSLITSPRTAIANVQGRNGTATHINQLSRSLPSDFDLYPTNQQPSRTYESFWQDHSTRIPHHRQPTNAPGISPPAPKLSLAPPADIRPTPRSRRSDAKFSKPPTIPGRSRSDLSKSSHQSFNNTPRTPQRDLNHDAVSLTPTQKTLQEQDAIETLLFMSSPGNSGNIGPAFPPPRTQASPPQSSPLKHEFGSQVRGAQGRRVGFERVNNVPSTATMGGYNSGRNKMKQKAKDIDRLLDEMGDSSSDDELVVPKYPSPRPRASAAAGRF